MLIFDQIIVYPASSSIVEIKFSSINFLFILFFSLCDSFVIRNIRHFAAIVVSETEGEEDDESQPTKKEKEKGGHDAHNPPGGAIRKLTGLLSLSAPDSSKSGYETTINFSTDVPPIAAENTSGYLKTGNQKCEIPTFTLKVDKTGCLSSIQSWKIDEQSRSNRKVCM